MFHDYNNSEVHDLILYNLKKDRFPGMLAKPLCSQMADSPENSQDH